LRSPSPLHNERIVNWLKFFTHASLDGDGHLEFQTTGATKGLLSASAPDKQKDARDESRNAMIRMSPQPDTGEVLACSRLDIHSSRRLPDRRFPHRNHHERWRVGGFLNKMGLEFTPMRTAAAIYFLVHGAPRSQSIIF
jgi:hypothetical protein